MRIIFFIVLFFRINCFADIDKTYDQLKIIVDIYNRVMEDYVEVVTSSEIVVSAAKGITKALDPFSQFMEPEAYKEMKVETEGEFGGLGIRISIKEGVLTVITPLPNTPAFKAGILPEDKIIKIEGESTENITINDAVKKLRGKPGTQVTITIQRENLKEPFDITLTRDIIKIPSTKSKIIEDFGYIKLYEFTAKTTEDLEKEIEKLKKNNIKGLIFDLRNNPGGLLDIAVDVCKLFLPKDKLIVYTKGRKKEMEREYKTTYDGKYSDLPLIILVNEGSASGSEIVAGCMQDHKRALIIGWQTFGKASVQSVYQISNGNALRLTTAKYYTPSGKSIHRDEKTKTGGIIPDIKIEVPKEIQAKLLKQEEEIFKPEKEPQSVVPESEKVKDEVLERAVELLKAREFFIK